MDVQQATTSHLPDLLVYAQPPHSDMEVSHLSGIPTRQVLVRHFGIFRLQFLWAAVVMTLYLATWLVVNEQYQKICVSRQLMTVEDDSSSAYAYAPCQLAITWLAATLFSGCWSPRIGRSRYTYLSLWRAPLSSMLSFNGPPEIARLLSAKQ